MPGPYTEEERLQRALDLGIIVDEQDMWLLSAYTWYISNGYAKTALPWDAQGRPFVFLHHAIMGYPIWEGDTIDHIDRNTMNNARSNMRYATHYVQLQNRSNVLEAAGVYKAKGNYFCYYLMRNGIKYYEGGFATPEEAKAARD